MSDVRCPWCGETRLIERIGLQWFCQGVREGVARVPVIGPRVLVFRLLPCGRRHLCFLAPTFDLAWVYYIDRKRRKRDGRMWVEHEYRQATMKGGRPMQEAPVGPINHRQDDTGVDGCGAAPDRR